MRVSLGAAGLGITNVTFNSANPQGVIGTGPVTLTTPAPGAGTAGNVPSSDTQAGAPVSLTVPSYKTGCAPVWDSAQALFVSSCYPHSPLSDQSGTTAPAVSAVSSTCPSAEQLAGIIDPNDPCQVSASATSTSGITAWLTQTMVDKIPNWILLGVGALIVWQMQQSRRGVGKR